ncbi:hypothetical protein [Amycolatopsis aidingensis]|uniref:hypothetical protein n=1 Tax=Amycolatopsis aidingensis TaxID=2842453 RepID=UPI001C0CCB29|nr:hypothetical protein [Amycolatopsis aidingensis]
MGRHVWILLGWSPDYGAPTTPVAVLGLDIGTDGTVTRHVEWMPRQYQHGQTWRHRLATTPAEELPARMQLWENSPTCPAARVEPLLPDRGLSEAVQFQFDDLLRPS